MVAGRAFICPFGWPLQAYTGTKRVYYPPNHPFRPPNDVEPDGCFGTDRAAAAAGYELAPIPPGYQLLDGVYLMPVDLAGCREAADATGLTMACPSLLPSPGRAGTAPSCDGPTSFALMLRPPCVWMHAFVFEYSGFAVPPGYDLDGANAGTHLVITAYRPSDPRLDPEAPYVLQCPEGTKLDTVPLHQFAIDESAMLVRCPLGRPPNSDHILLRWTRDGINYAVSLHGDSQANRNLLLAIANAVYYARPEAMRGYALATCRGSRRSPETSLTSGRRLKGIGERWSCQQADRAAHGVSSARTPSSRTGRSSSNFPTASSAALSISPATRLGSGRGTPWVRVMNGANLTLTTTLTTRRPPGRSCSARSRARRATSVRISSWSDRFRW